MAKQTINIGTGELAGDGETLRTAFDKTNDNFTEVYNDIAALTSSAFSGDYNDLSNLPSLFSGDYNSLSNLPDLTNRDISGSVFADNSTLLVDAINGVIPASVVSGTLNNNTVGTHTGPVDGDLVGSVFADDSTLLVDGVNGVIPGYEKIRPVDAANAPPFVDFPETLNPDTHSGMELISTPTGAPRLTLPDGSYNGQTYFVTQNYQGGSDVEITVTNYYNKATEAIETVTVTGAAQFVWTGTWWTKIG